MSNQLSTGTWVSISEHSPLRCTVESDDFVVFTIGGDLQNIELMLNAEGLRKLAEVTAGAVAELEAFFDQTARS